MQLIFHTPYIQLPKHFLEICPSLSKILLMYPWFVHVNYCLLYFTSEIIGSPLLNYLIFFKEKFASNHNRDYFVAYKMITITRKKYNLWSKQHQKTIYQENIQTSLLDHSRKYFIYQWLDILYLDKLFLVYSLHEIIHG